MIDAGSENVVHNTRLLNEIKKGGYMKEDGKVESDYEEIKWSFAEWSRFADVITWLVTE